MQEVDHHSIRRRAAASFKAKKGRVAVRVGLETEQLSGGDSDSQGLQRFEIPISYLYHPLFSGLLEAAHETYGYRYSSGPLTLPCSVDDFLHLRWLIERECGGGGGGGSGSSSSQHHHGGLVQQQSHHPLRFNPSIYFHSCR